MMRKRRVQKQPAKQPEPDLDKLLREYLYWRRVLPQRLGPVYERHRTGRITGREMCALQRVVSIQKKVEPHLKTWREMIRKHKGRQVC